VVTILTLRGILTDTYTEKKKRALRIEKEENTKKKKTHKSFLWHQHASSWTHQVPPLLPCTSHFGTHKKLPEPATTPPSKSQKDYIFHGGQQRKDGQTQRREKKNDIMGFTISLHRTSKLLHSRLHAVGSCRCRRRCRRQHPPSSPLPCTSTRLAPLTPPRCWKPPLWAAPAVTAINHARRRRCCPCQPRRFALPQHLTCIPQTLIDFWLMGVLSAPHVFVATPTLSHSQNALGHKWVFD